MSRAIPRHLRNRKWRRRHLRRVFYNYADLSFSIDGVPFDMDGMAEISRRIERRLATPREPSLLGYGSPAVFKFATSFKISMAAWLDLTRRPPHIITEVSEDDEAA